MNDPFSTDHLQRRPKQKSHEIKSQKKLRHTILVVQQMSAKEGRKIPKANQTTNEIYIAMVRPKTKMEDSNSFSITCHIPSCLCQMALTPSGTCICFF